MKRENNLKWEEKSYCSVIRGSENLIIARIETMSRGRERKGEREVEAPMN